VLRAALRCRCCYHPFPNADAETHMCARRPVRRGALERRPEPLLGSGAKTATDVNTDTGYVTLDDVVAHEMQQPKGGIPPLIRVSEGTSSLGGGSLAAGGGVRPRSSTACWYHFKNKPAKTNMSTKRLTRGVRMRGTIAPVRIRRAPRGSGRRRTSDLPARRVGITSVTQTTNNA